MGANPLGTPQRSIDRALRKVVITFHAVWCFAGLPPFLPIVI